MTLRANDLPPQLTSAPNWIGWKLETSDSGRATKVPYSLLTGRKGSSTNPADWTTFDAALVLANGSYSGLGFVFSADLGMTGIDLDTCYDDADNIKPWAVPYLLAFEGTYSEVSPSGKGIKFWVLGQLPPGASGIKVYVDKDGNPVKEGDPKCDGAVEMYQVARYFTVTGDAVGPLDVIDCQSVITRIYARLKGTREKSTSAPVTADEVAAPGGRHAMLLSVAGRWRNDGMGPEEILIGLRQINQKKCDPPKSEHELKGIVDFLAKKPPKYRLVPKDYDQSRKVVNGAPEPPAENNPLIDAQSAEISSHSDEARDAARLNSLQNAEEILASVIAGNDSTKIYDALLIDAVAAAGDIMRHEAKRRLKAAFKSAFVVKEWDARVSAATGAWKRNTDEPVYIMTSTGKMEGCVANAVTMMGRLPLSWNAFSHKAYLTAESPWGSTGAWTDNDDVSCQVWVQRHGLNIAAPGTILNAAINIAAKNTYHPVLDYLNSLTWDGVPRLDLWLTTYLGVIDSTYVRNVAAKWMIAACKRVNEPGCQCDYTLVLEGGQGKRKSTALRVLASAAWFIDNIRDIGSVDCALQLLGKWIIELAELDAFNKKDMTSIKAWLTSPVDNYRTPYGRQSADTPRQCIFAATTNKSDWNNDDTGGRRFWPVTVGEIDIDRLTADRDQLWAEAYSRYSAGELSYFDADIEAVAVIEQEKRRPVDAWFDRIDEWVACPVRRVSYNPVFDMRSMAGRIYIDDIFGHCLGMAEGTWTDPARRRITSILRALGYVDGKRDKRNDPDPATGKRKEYWSLINAD